MRFRRIIPFVGALLAALLLVVFESDVLWQWQEQNLFLNTPLFFSQCMVSSGGLLTWTGAYLTQFLYYPLLGAGLLCLLWAFLIWLLKHTFHIGDRWEMLTLVPVAMLLLASVTPGYWLFFLKLRGCFFDATVGSLVAVLLVWLYRRITARYYLSTVFVAASTFISYPLFGFYGLLATLLMGIVAMRQKKRAVADSLTAIVCIVGVPLLCYYLLFHETHLSRIYFTALPQFSIRQEDYPVYYIPYVVLVLSLVLFAAAEPCRHSIQQQERRLSRLVPAFILTLTVAGVAVFWYKDGNFHTEMSMSRLIAQQDWEGAISSAAKAKEPTRAICMMRNLALFRTGRLGDELYHFPNTAKRPAAPFAIHNVHTQGKMLYLQFGIPNYCYRWCMEDGVEYGWRAETLKLMVKCSLLNGEMIAAQQYLNLLKKTVFHRSWAKRYEAYVHDARLIAKDPELAPILPLLRDDNFLTADQSQLEHFLIEQLASSPGKTPQQQELSLVATLFMRHLSQFWPKFYNYTEQHLGEHVPVHYQEAACLFGHLDNINVSHMPFDPQVVSNYEAFSTFVSQCQQNGLSMEQIRPKVYERFHHTFYYDFYFNQIKYLEQ